MDSDSNDRKAKNWHVRITRSWSDLSGVIIRMAEFGPITAAYEHTPDQGCKRQHIHILFYSSTFAVNTVKDWIKKIFKPEAHDWRFKTTYKINKGTPQEQEVPITEASYPQLITYMSKGKLEPKYVKGIEMDNVRHFRDCWVEHKKTAAIQPVTESSEPKGKANYITLVDLQGECLNDYMVLIKDLVITDEQFRVDRDAQEQLTDSCANTAKRIHGMRLLRQRVCKRTVIELAEFCMLHLYPKSFSKACVYYWKF